MWKPLQAVAVSTLLATSLTAFVGTASAVPFADPLAIKNASRSPIEPVRWGGWGWGWGVPVVGAVVAGEVIGGMAPYYYGPGPYYYPDPYYAGPYYYPAPVYAPAPAYAPAPVVYGVPGYVPADVAVYCAQRFRSYDPRSGTYVGAGGRRRLCR